MAGPVPALRAVLAHGADTDALIKHRA